MPREVYLEPNGSPFVNNAPFNYEMNQSMGGDSTLTDLSFQDNDNLLNTSSFAGLADVTTGGIGDDTSVMKMSGAGNASEDLLMGVKGDEFLADDSMDFLSKSTATTRAHSKFEQSTAAPPEPEPAPVEEQEKPRRKSGKSSSPAKKRSSAATTPIVEEPMFPAAQMETMPEEPEPEPEPKLRRSPRKARSTSTRLGASVSAGVSPFASTSSQPSAQPTPEKTPEAQTESLPTPEAAEPEPEPKTKRSSRVVGRSKSKSRGKSAKFEEPLNEEPPKAEESAASTPVVEREPTPAARETTPTNARETTPVPPQPQMTLAFVQTTPTSVPQASPPTASPTPQIPIQATSPAPPVVPPTSRPAPTTRRSLASVPTSQPVPVPTRQSLAPAPTTRQSLAPTSDPVPFKFNLPPSFGRRAQSLAPTPVTPSFPAARTSNFPTTPTFPVAPTPAFSNPVSALPSPALALATPGPAFSAASSTIASDPPSTTAPEDKEDDLKYEQPSKEEEEEAVAIAMRITRRDSSIFAALMSPIRAPAFSQQVDTPEAEELMESNATGEDETRGNGAATEPAPVPKRTRVGRGSTARGRGGAGVAVAVMGRVTEDEDVERVQVPVAPQGQEQQREQELDDMEEEKQIIQEQPDVAVPVNFGSRSPSPTPPPPPPEEHRPSVIENKPKVSFGTRTRTTRASMPTSQPARTTRSTRRSEVQQPTSRGLGTTATLKETLIEKPTEVEQGAQIDVDKPIEDVSTPIRAADPPTLDATTPLDPISPPHDIISTTPLDSPAVSAPGEPTPASLKATAAQKASDNKGPQRVATRASAAVASQRNASASASASGSSQPQPRRAAPATHKPSSSGSAKPPSTGSAKPPSTGKPASTDGPQRAGVAQKPTSQKLAPTNDKPSSATQQESVTEPDVPKAEPEPKVRAVRALPKRASRSSNVPTIIEDSMEIERDEVCSPEQPAPVQNAAPVFASIWPRDPAPNPFAPATATVVSNDDSPKTNKRRAPSPEPEPESLLQATDPNDSPNKRVRFTAVLEAGPTPGIGRVLKMPKPSLKKVKKIRIERKANRPKRVLTRDWVVGGSTPSYAAPLKRDVREREATTERPPPTESQTNSRATIKSNPTVPIPFTFRSELRMKPQPTEQAYLPAAIPIAAPMPDFAAAHAAAEAANLARRQRAQEAFLAAQAELDSYRNSKHMIGAETARRAAERAVFDAAMKVKEAEAERIRYEQRKLEAEREAEEIKELRKRAVPKANPVPEFYKYAPRTAAQDLDA